MTSVSFQSIGECCGGGIVEAIDVGEFDVAIFLKYTGPERRTNNRDAPHETELAVDIAGPNGQALFARLFGRIDMVSSDMGPNPVGWPHKLLFRNIQVLFFQFVVPLAQVTKIILAI
jgi:hypothetical protein